MTNICDICNKEKDDILIYKFGVDEKELKICEDCEKEIFKHLATVKEVTIWN